MNNILIALTFNLLQEAPGSVRFQTVSIEDGSVQTVRFLCIIRFGSIYDDHDDDDRDDDDDDDDQHDDDDDDDDDCGANPRWMRNRFGGANGKN